MTRDASTSGSLSASAGYARKAASPVRHLFTARGVKRRCSQLARLRLPGAALRSRAAGGGEAVDKVDGRAHVAHHVTKQGGLRAVPRVEGGASVAEEELINE